VTRRSPPAGRRRLHGFASPECGRGAAASRAGAEGRSTRLGRDPAGGASATARPRRGRLAILCLAAAAALIGAAAATAGPAGEPRWSPRRADEHGFDDDQPFLLDVDDDGDDEEIRPWVTELRRSLIPGVERFAGGEIEYYLNLAVAARRGDPAQRSLYRFRYGTENGGYRRYALVPIGDADGDGRADLALSLEGRFPFELVVLLDEGERFAARVTGPLPGELEVTKRLEIAEAGRRRSPEPARVRARWDPAARRFVGDGLVWVIGAAAQVRARVENGGEIVATVAGGTPLLVVDVPPAGERPPGWLPVAVGERRGWVSELVVEDRSPEEQR